MPAIRIEIQGQSFDAPLPDAPVRIGKNPDVDLAIQGAGVGGEHCVLEPLGGGRTKLKDLGSGYETLVNGVPVKQISLNDGDVVQVGEARITYLAHAAGAAPEAIPDAIPSGAEAIPAAAPPPPPPPPPPARPKAAKAKAAAPKPKAAADAPKTDVPKADAPKVDEPKAETPKVERADRKSKPKAKSKVPMAGLLGGAIVLIGIVFAIGALGGGGGDVSYAKDLARAQRLFDEHAYDEARDTWQQVYDRAPVGDDKQAAADGLAVVGARLREMDAKLERLVAEGLDITPHMLSSQRTRFLLSYGDAQAPRFDAAKAEVLRAQAEWKATNVDVTRALAEKHLETSAFVDARDAWDTLGAKAPVAIDVTAEVREAFADLESRANAKADELIERATAWNEAGMPYRSVKLLKDMLPNFKDFESEARLQKALTTAIAERNKPIEIPDTGVPHRRPGHPTSDTPGRDRPGGDRPGRDPTRPPVRPTDPTPPGTGPTPPVDPEQGAAHRKQADAMLAAAAEEADARRFREAAAQLATAMRALPEGVQRARVAGVAEDYGLAAKAKDGLVAHIKASPEAYANVRIAPRLKVSLVDADAEYLHAKVTGGHSKHAWARLPATAWQGLVKRRKPQGEDAVAAAALLRVLSLADDAERLLATAIEQGAAKDAVFARLARWRGIAVPQGGFVLYEDRYVTPAERDHLVREAQIAAALAQLDSRKREERDAAAKELLAIGDPARERFEQALQRRRAFLIDEIARSKSFTSGKYKTKLLQLLEERRKAALALIYDAQAYPYPNPQKKNQAEVEALVDLVREVWERPFDLVSQWDKKLQERMQGLTEVDGVLSQVSPGYAPDLGELKERINKAIDVPGSADAGKREYSLKVLVYNTTLDTTAGVQEKANVRSVNEYRMMMGLLAVKIDEKLVRAARGHSRHMATNGYFAHDVPPPYATPTNRSPGLRAKQQGFGGGVGENIARGPGTGHGAFMAWFRSSGHHRNMLGKGWLVMGCGRANQTWWTQLFGGGSKSLTPPDPLPPPDAPFAPDPAK